MPTHLNRGNEIDLGRLLTALKLRWWLLPVSVVLVLAAVLIQPQLSGSDANQGLLTVTKAFEAKIETAPLSIIGFDPGATTPFPSFDNQLAALQDPIFVEKIQSSIPSPIQVAVTRSEPKFTMVDTIDESNNRVTFLSRGTSSYVFSCVSVDEQACLLGIDGYVQEVSRLRYESITTGLKTNVDFLDQLIKSASSRLDVIASTSDSYSIAAEQAGLVDLNNKRQAVMEIIDQISGELQEVSTSTNQLVVKPKYTPTSFGFGVIFGLVIGILVALQLALIDKRVRSERDISVLNPEVKYLGRFSLQQIEGTSIPVIAAILSNIENTAVSTVRFVSVSDKAPASTSLLFESLSRRQISCELLLASKDLTVDTLLPTSKSAIVYLISTEKDRIDQWLPTHGAFTKAGNQILGCALVDK